MADFIETEYQGIPYRAKRTEHVEDGGIIWHVEYKQARTYDWGPRGRFNEKDGRFYFGDLEFETAYEALRYRATH